MRATLLACLTCMIGLAGVSATAQQAGEDGEAEIVVLGEAKDSPAEIRDAVRQISEPLRSDQPLVRFHDPLCLSVSGLGQRGSALVSERVEANAREAGLEVGRPGCTANALILIVDEPALLLDRIAEEQPWLMNAAERTRLDSELAAGTRVLAWHNEEARSTEGAQLPHAATVPGLGGSAAPMRVAARINVQGRPRRVGISQSRAAISGVVILDVDDLVDMELTQVADHATMRLLAPGLRPIWAAGTGPQSVLAPFVADGGEPALTRFDRAFLAGLYGLQPNAPANRLPGAVAEAFRDRADEALD